MFVLTLTLGALQRKTNSKNPRLYGSGWVGPGLTLNFFWKSSQNSPKSCWLLRFECSVHVSDGFPKKSLDGGGWVGGVSSIQVFFFDFWNFFNFAKSLSCAHIICFWLQFKPGERHRFKRQLRRGRRASEGKG